MEEERRPWREERGGGGPSGGSRREGEISRRERPLGTSQSKDPANRVSSSLCLLLYFTSFLIPPNSTVQEPGRRHEKPEETLASLLHLFLPSIHHRSLIGVRDPRFIGSFSLRIGCLTSQLITNLERFFLFYYYIRRSDRKG